MGKTSKVMAGITSTALMIGLAGCSSDAQNRPPVPKDKDCSNWEWDQDDGVWKCEDSGSRYFGHSYYGGHYYRSKSALHNAKDYISYKNSSSFKGGTSSEGSHSRSSGFGSGSRSFGG